MESFATCDLKENQTSIQSTFYCSLIKISNNRNISTQKFTEVWKICRNLFELNTFCTVLNKWELPNVVYVKLWQRFIKTVYFITGLACNFQCSNPGYTEGMQKWILSNAIKHALKENIVTTPACSEQKIERIIPKKK